MVLFVEGIIGIEPCSRAWELMKWLSPGTPDLTSAIWLAAKKLNFNYHLLDI